MGGFKGQRLLLFGSVSAPPPSYTSTAAMAAKRSRPGAYISIRIGQVLLCAGHLYVCSALVFFFGDNVNRSDYALGYRHKREAIPGRGGGSYSGGSGGSGGGDKGPSDPQMPAMFLLGVVRLLSSPRASAPLSWSARRALSPSSPPSCR